jgi:hypothetical protein
MLGPGHREVDRVAGKSRVTSKLESESKAQRFAFAERSGAPCRRSPPGGKGTCAGAPQRPAVRSHAVSRRGEPRRGALC